MTAKPYLPPTPLDDDAVVITAIETVQPRDLFPGLLLRAHSHRRRPHWARRDVLLC